MRNLPRPLILVVLASAACARASGPSANPLAAPSPKAPAIHNEPVLQAPWNEIDFWASDAVLQDRFAATASPDCARGTYKLDGLCWQSDDRTGDQIISIHVDSLAQAQELTRAWGASVFGSTREDETWQTWHLRVGERRVVATLIQGRTTTSITLQPLMPLRETIAWMTSLVGLDHEAVTQKLGKRGSHRQPACEKILCFFQLPENEAGEVSGSVEFADGVATRAMYGAWCEPGCALGPVMLAAFDKTFGARKTESRPSLETGELWTYHTYARSPGLVIKAREYAQQLLFVCVGACD